MADGVRYQVKDAQTQELLATFDTRRQAETSARALRDYQERETRIEAIESTPPKPLEPQRTHVPFTTSDVCWCQPFDGPMHPQCPMHGDKCQCKDGPCLSDDMLERGYVCASLTPPKPAHIDTTAPEVIRPELQMLEIDSSPKGPEFPFDVPDDDNGYKCEPTPSPIDTTGQERCLTCDKPKEECEWWNCVVPSGHSFAPASIATTQGDGEPCIDCCEPGSTKETIEEQKIPYGQTGVVLTAYVPVFTCTKCGMQWTDWRGEGIREKVVAAYLAQPKPAPQAEAQESLPAEPKELNGNEEITWDMLWVDRKKWIDYARKVVEAWNAQQAKIDALEQKLDRAEGRIGLLRVEKDELEKEVGGLKLSNKGILRTGTQMLEKAESRIAELEEKLREVK